MKIWIITALLLTVSSSIQASGDYAEHRKGRYWGKPLPTPEEQALIDERTPEPLPSIADMMKMHPDDIRALEKERMDYALWQKTPEAVRDYYKVITVIRKNARTFAALHGLNKQTDLSLNVTPDYPITQAGVILAREERRKEYNNKLANNKEQFALVMFTQEGCSFCHAMYGVLKQFEQRHDWNIKYVDRYEHPVLAAKHNIEIAPTVIMISRDYPDRWMPISYGAVSVPEVEENTYRAIRLIKEEIKPAQYYTPGHQVGRGFDPLANSGD